MTVVEAAEATSPSPTALREVDPSRDVRDRIAEEGGIVEAADKIWFHKLAAAVIDASRCVRCGTCVAACPSSSIGLGTDGLPTLVRMCTGCSSCWDFCPLAGLRAERLQRLCASESSDGLGPLLAAYEARAKDRPPHAQDGGAVTALLTALLEQGYLDGALLSHKHGPLRGETVLATSIEEIRQGAGSVYDQSYPLAKLALGLPHGIERIALVGTPCQVTGLRALQRYPWRYRRAPVEKVVLAIALFCTRSFDPQRLTLELVRRGLELERTARVDIREGTFRAYDATGAMIFETKVSRLGPAALAGCDECADFTGALADIAAGNAGSRRGATTVLIRTERGREAWERAAASLEIRPLTDLSAVATLAAKNRQRAARRSCRGLDAGRELWVSYTAYLQAALGSEHAPVAPPRHRSHHYTVAC